MNYFTLPAFVIPSFMTHTSVHFTRVTNFLRSRASQSRLTQVSTSFYHSTTQVMHLNDNKGTLETGFEQRSRNVDRSSNIDSLGTMDFQKVTMPTAGSKQDKLLEAQKHISPRKEVVLQDNSSECQQYHHMSNIESDKLEAHYAAFDSSEQHAICSQIKQDQNVEEMCSKPSASISSPSKHFSSSETVSAVILHDEVKVQLRTESQKTASTDVEEVQPSNRIYTRRHYHVKKGAQNELNSSNETNMLQRHRKNVHKQVDVQIAIKNQTTGPIKVEEQQPLNRVYTRRHSSVNKAVQSSETKILQRHRKNMHQEVEDQVKEDSLSLQNGEIEFQDHSPLEVVASPRKRRVTIKQIQAPELEMVASMTSEENVYLVNTREPWTMLIHKKLQPGWVAYNPATMRPGHPETQKKYLKLLSWNVNGLRALLKDQQNSMMQLIERENFDVLCLQETKLQEKDVEKISESFFSSYQTFWSCSISKLGYSGTAILSKQQPLSVRYGLGNKNHDNEGRLITLEFETFYLVAGYVPNSGQKLERLAYRTEEWDISLSNYLKGLEKSKPVILTGDLNCAYQEIDIHNPDGNRRSAGFTNEERSSFETNFLTKGFVDSFRRQHPNAVAYTYWGYRGGARHTNKGWRLDYFLVSETIADLVYDSYTVPDIFGSDHCPVGLIIKFS